MKVIILKINIIAFLTFALISSCSKPGTNPPPSGSSGNYVVSTMAGSGVEGSADGTSTTAQFNKPGAITVDLLGNVYVAQTANFSIRKITTSGMVSTIAGGSEGYADGQGIAAQFKSLAGLATDGQGNIYVADNTRLRKITTAGVVTTVAGSETSGYADGTGSLARFKSLTAVATDLQGNIYAFDNDMDIGSGGTGIHIRKITPAGIVSTLVSGGVVSYTIALDAGSNIYWAGLWDIQKLTLSGVRSKLNGLGFPTDIKDIALDAQGNIFYTASDATGNYNKIFALSSSGVTTSIAGTGIKGFKDGKASEAQFDNPAITVDGLGNIYVSDRFNNRIRKISKN